MNIAFVLLILLDLMKHIIDRLHLQMLYAGSRKLTAALEYLMDEAAAAAAASGAVDIV